VGIFSSIIDAYVGSIRSMARTKIDIDEAVLSDAAKELGTSSKVDTVNAALAFIAGRRRLARAFDDDLIWGSPDLADPEVRRAARR
jgi:Arc/MetJ family transcription regulator